MRCLQFSRFLALLLLLSAFACPGGAASLSWIPSIVRAQDEQVSIAYFIQISEATITMLPRLLRVMYHPENTYVIHMDKKIPEWQRAHAVSSLMNGDDRYESNVHILPSEPVTYRGISMVLNLLSAMQAATDSSGDWTYFINISGSDYPLVSATNQRRLLTSQDFATRKRSFLSIANKDWWSQSREYRFERLFTDTSLSFNNSEHRIVDSYTDQPIAFVHNFTFVAAEAWMVLHRDLVDFMLTGSRARRMLLAFAYALEPEEHYFATLAYNTPEFNDSLVPHSLRHVEWVHNGKHSGQHPYYVDQMESDGNTFMFLEKIQRSGCFFTRKIREKDSPILDYIDTHINGMSDKAVTKDVDDYVKLVSDKLECVSQLKSSEYADPCFYDDESVDDK
ncbi:Xylosyltransferase family GT14 [Gracilaria domingensis]|nr:Xylosyltransferase family GT14 [Gracilaria domingensis]